MAQRGPWTRFGSIPAYRRIHLDQIDNPAKDLPIGGIEVARRPLLDTDEDIPRQQAISDGRLLAEFIDRKPSQDSLAALLPDLREASQQLLRNLLP